MPMVRERDFIYLFILNMDKSLREFHLYVLNLLLKSGKVTNRAMSLGRESDQ